MTDFALIVIGTVLVNNIVLVKFLGLCPLLGTSQRLDIAAGMSLATAFVLTLAAALSYLLDHYLLQVFGLEYLRILSFILVIAGTVQFTEFMTRSISPVLHQALGIYLPLITTNCAVLGIALLNTRQSTSLFDALAYGLGAGLGFGVVMLLFAGLRERLEATDIPLAFRGPAIALVTAGLLSMAFMGFAGIARG